jgi:hypothetical protein
VDGKEVKFEEAFLAPAGWVKTLEVEVKNTSKDRTLLHVAVAIRFDDWEVPLELDMNAGYPHFYTVPKEPVTETLNLKPGETTKIVWNQSYAQLLEQMHREKGTTLVSAVSLYPLIAINADRKTGWFRGHEGFRYSDKIWVRDDADWSDPEFQKTLDPNYKPSKKKARLEKLRWDEGSNQYVLDSANPPQACSIPGNDIAYACQLDPQAECVIVAPDMTPCSMGQPGCRNESKMALPCKRIVGGQVYNCGWLEEVKRTTGTCIQTFP